MTAREMDIEAIELKDMTPLEIAINVICFSLIISLFIFV